MPKNRKREPLLLLDKQLDSSVRPHTCNNKPLTNGSHECFPLLLQRPSLKKIVGEEKKEEPLFLLLLGLLLLHCLWPMPTKVSTIILAITHLPSSLHNNNNS